MVDQTGCRTGVRERVRSQRYDVRPCALCVQSIVHAITYQKRPCALNCVHPTIRHQSGSGWAAGLLGRNYRMCLCLTCVCVCVNDGQRVRAIFISRTNSFPCFVCVCSRSLQVVCAVQCAGQSIRRCACVCVYPQTKRGEPVCCIVVSNLARASEVRPHSNLIGYVYFDSR